MRQPEYDLFDLKIEPHLQKAFDIYHAENPRVYELFKRFAFEAIRAGYEKFGAKSIFERARWEISIHTRGDDFKLNNNYTAFYSRLFMKDFPQYEGFFETRIQKKTVVKVQ